MSLVFIISKIKFLNKMHHVYGKGGKTAVNKNVLILDTFTGKKNKPVSFFLLLLLGKKQQQKPQTDY